VIRREDRPSPTQAGRSTRMPPDRKPGADSGQALNLNGGLWYVLSPSGKVIRTKP